MVKAKTISNSATPSEEPVLPRLLMVSLSKHCFVQQVTRGAGSKVSVSLPVETYDETVLVGLKAQDEEGRRGERGRS